MSASLRDLEVLRRLARHRFLSRSQVEAFLFDGANLGDVSKDVLTRRVLKRLTSRGLVSATRRLVGGPGGGSARLGYFLTGDGAAFAGAAGPRRAARRGKGTFLLAHSLMAADVALAFTRSARSHAGHQLLDWESYEQGAAELRGSRLVPDARVAYTTPAWRLDAFVEIDLATEGTRFFSAKIHRYLDYYRSDTWRARLPTWPAVLTVTPTAQRASALRVATEAVVAPYAERIAQATKFAFAALDDLLGARGPLGTIWQVAGREGLELLIPEDREERTKDHG